MANCVDKIVIYKGIANPSASHTKSSLPLRLRNPRSPSPSSSLLASGSSSFGYLLLSSLATQPISFLSVLGIFIVFCFYFAKVSAASRLFRYDYYRRLNPRFEKLNEMKLNSDDLLIYLQSVAIDFRSSTIFFFF